MDLSSFRVPSPLEEVFYIPNFITEEEEAYLLRKINESSPIKWKSLADRRLQIWGGEVTSHILIPRPMPSFVMNYPNLIRRLRETGVFTASKHGEPNHIIVNEYKPGQGIMPHEDGPCYHPVVATLSLGSHAVFHYHQYVLEPPDNLVQNANPSTSSVSPRGKSIDPKPVLSLLLEPRSLVITAKSLYLEYLHSIEPVEADVFAPASHASSKPPGLSSNGDVECHKGIQVSNWEAIRDERMKEILWEGGSLKRGTRVSLTCRDVEKVLSGSFGGRKHLV